MGLFSPNVKKLRAKGDVRGLIKALRYKEAEVRKDAAEALGEIRDKKASEDLFHIARGADLGDFAPGEVGEEEIEALIEALKDEDPRIRKIVAETLGRIGDKKAVEPLIEALKDEDPEVRKFVAFQLAWVKDKKAVEPLIEALKDKDPEVRINVADYLSMFGDERAIEPLIEALKDENPKVRKDVAETLERLEKKRRLNLLSKR